MKGLFFVAFDDDTSRARPLLWPRHAVRSLLNAPPIRRAIEARYEEEFSTATRANLFRGVYPSFDEAARAAPPTKPMGYDNPGPAAMYRKRPARLPLSDYPALFWISRFVPGAKRLFDLGGHVGLRYYDFRALLELPPGFTWQVMDVPAVVDAGRVLAVEEKASHLTFTTRREDLDGSDILFCSGSLQYLEKPLHEILAAMPSIPRHVIVHAMPMRDGLPFYTLQSIGTAFCPYRIEDRTALASGMAALGYELLDTWMSPEKFCALPFHPDHSIRGDTGMSFRRR